MSPLSPGRRFWLRELTVLLGLSAAAVVLFAVTGLDVAASRPFYRAGPADRWPLAKELPWSALYGAAPWLAALLVLAGLGMLALGSTRRRERLRRDGIFLLLAVVVGPGLIVNLLFKDHWGRPRPRDIVEFGGPSPYRSPLLPQRGGAASFPCGHCSVGFLLGAGWWIWKGRRPALARASLALGLAAGTAIGLGRMAAGGHFLSDVVWSALLALGIAHAIHYHVLPLAPAEESSLRASRGRSRAVAVLSALGGLGVLLALFVAPHGTSLAARIPFGSLPAPPKAFEFVARTASVEIVLVDAPDSEITISGELHGFGLPTSELSTRTDFDASAGPALRYTIVQRGWFTDLDGSATIRLPAAGFTRVTVRVGKGNIRVTDTTREGVVASGRLRLELSTSAGHVDAPPVP